MSDNIIALRCYSVMGCKKELNKGVDMMNVIENIEARINQKITSIIKFNPEKHNYNISVPYDCFAIMLRLKYDPEYYISITADHDSGRYGFEELDHEMGDYIAGHEIPYYEYYDGYIVRLDKRESVYKKDLKETVTITASSAVHESEVYTIHITRSANKKIRNLFKLNTYHDEEFDLNMPYELYVPSDYDPKNKYPVMIALHGTGERMEPTEAILQKMAMATCWAEDSEKGHNKCIVIAPQCIIKYDEDDNWTTVNQFVHKRTESPFYSMPQLKTVWKILNEIISKYSVDKTRLYLTGTSSGGFGAYELAMDHPKTFAAIIAVSCACNPAKLDKINDIPVWVFHADDDPIMDPSWTLDPLLPLMEKAGINFKLTRYPKGHIFWQSGHFCWEVCYHDKSMRDWVFQQSR